MGTNGAPTTRTGIWSASRDGFSLGEVAVTLADGEGAVAAAYAGLLLLAAEAGCSTATPPAITTLTSVTPASKTRLQCSSRILMQKKRVQPVLVPRAGREPNLPQARNVKGWNKA